MSKFDPKNIKVKKVVTVPVLTPVVDTPLYLKFTGPIYKGKELKGSEKNNKMEPADLAPVINLETGEENLLIVSAVVKGNFEEHYSKDAYVNKAFELIKLPKREGKRYFDFSIKEIEV